MPRPRYTWWPWRTLALAVPVVSVGAAFFAILTEVKKPGSSTEQMALLAGLTIFGAGNRFLLGAAIGDFGRSILAMLAGATAAFLVAPYADGLGILPALIFICAAISATLALDWTPRGILGAVWTGLAALLFGAVAGLFASFVFPLILWVQVRAQVSESFRWWIAFVCLTLPLMVGNLFFIGKIFQASFRAQRSTAVDAGSGSDPQRAAGAEEEKGFSWRDLLDSINSD